MTSTEIEHGDWLKYALAIGIISLVSYFLGSVFNVLPWPVGRSFFLISGPTYALGVYCLGQWLRRDYDSIALRMAILMNVIAGVVNGAMAAVQSLNGAVISEKMKATTDEAALDLLRTAYHATNNTQLGLDIAWDIWVNLGTALFALAISRHFILRPWLGILGMGIALGSFINNMIYFPWPPADKGSIDLGPFIGVWWGLVLVVIIIEFRRKNRKQS